MLFSYLSLIFHLDGPGHLVFAQINSEDASGENASVVDIRT